ncbi:Aldo/keto reductase [Panus rudis PR-1116 ss-1]|nr:Aldo/keto reductase [Panus rudis PR-1116 ss-1]
MSAPTFTLNNGVKIPAIGLGTWQSKPEDVTAAVEYAIKEVGYRHIDTAWAYGNEQAVGEGIRRSGVPRSELFITTKLWGTHHNAVEKWLDESLKNLGLDYVDLYLIHWPIALNPNGNDPVFPKRPDGSRDVLTDWPISKTWAQMEEVYKKGKAKSIGVSNVSIPILSTLLSTATIPPAVNQLEIHLYNPQHRLVSFLHEHNIIPEAYSPLGSTGSPLLGDETAREVAGRLGVQVADVLLGWLISKKIIPLPKSITPTRISSNYHGALLAAHKLSLPENQKEVELLDGVAANGKQRRLIMPPWGVDLGFDDWHA